MTSTGLVLLALGLALPAQAAPTPQAPQPVLRRFALIASSNDGGKERVPLRFADSDAQAMADVLRQLGGLQRDDLVLVTAVRRASFQSAFERMRASVAAAPRTGGRREMLVYYSGHSDEEGLLLGGERISYRELRQWIDQTDADVRIAILDSCASGALIRLRGGTRQPPFLTDLSADARGHAFLTASSAVESAQESDRIGAAFFTHFLVSGLRGAADLSRDGRITLAEAYQFAYHETLQRTERTVAGAQHPAYDFQLAGQGDLVLTDLRSTASSLVLEEKMAGRVFVRDPGGRLLVELRKEPVYAVQLGLPPGAYEVTLDRDGRAYRAAVVLAEGTATQLRLSQFQDLPLQAVTTRGATSGAAPGDPPPSLARTLIGDHSLIGQTRRLGGYAGMNFRYTRLGGRDGFLAGPEAALLINRQLAIGLLAAGGIGGRSEALDRGLALGYAAVFLRYHLLCDTSPLCLSLGAAAGPGGVAPARDAMVTGAAGGSSSIDESDADGVFIFEPQLGGHLNVTRFLRLGADVGYRMVAGADRYRTQDLRGLAAGFHLQLGWF